MVLISTKDEGFLATVESWIQAQGEILVAIRYSRAAGSKSYEFFTSFDAFVNRVKELPHETSVIVFRERQLPLRGVVSDDFISKSLDAIPDGSEFLVVETTRQTAGSKSWFHDTSGETHSELSEALQESLGRAVAVGKYPAWWEDTPDVISALVPNEHGLVRPGCY